MRPRVPRVGDFTRISILGGDECVSGRVASVVDVADAGCTLVELTDGSIGMVCDAPHAGDPPAGPFAQQAADEDCGPFADVEIASNGAGGHVPMQTVSASHVRVNSFVEVQALAAMALERGRVSEVLDNARGCQPVVRLASGTVGAVTLLESRGLPPRAFCRAMPAGTAIVILPLGTSSPEVAFLAEVLDSEAPEMLVAAVYSPGSTLVWGNLMGVLLPCVPDTSSSNSPPAPHSLENGEHGALGAAAAADGEALWATGAFTPGNWARDWADHKMGGAEAGGGCAAPDAHGLDQRLHALALDAEGAPAAQRAGTQSSLDAWSDSQQSEMSGVQRYEEVLAGKREEIRSAAALRGIDSSLLETLAMLNESTPLYVVLDVLERYSCNLEAAANALLAESPSAGPSGGWGADVTDAVSIAAGLLLDRPGLQQQPSKKKRGKGKKLDGCFGAPAAGTPQLAGMQQREPQEAGWGAWGAARQQHRTMADVVKAGQVASPPQARGGMGGYAAGSAPGTLQAPWSLDPARTPRLPPGASGFDDTLPEFLLPFIAEHVQAVEEELQREYDDAVALCDKLDAASPAGKGKKNPWVKVGVPRKPQTRKTIQDVVTLYCAPFRQCVREQLEAIAKRTTDRLRILTLCSTAANQGRVYDRSVIHKLSECTKWINDAKSDVTKAYILAARNTQLKGPPATIDLHYFDVETARLTVRGCVEALHESKQVGVLDIITGQGLHSHNQRSKMKPMVMALAREMGLDISCPDDNLGKATVYVGGARR